MLLHLQGGGEQGGGVDVGVAVDLAVAQETCVLQAGDHAQDAGLLAELEVVLEADEVVGVGAQVLLAKLDDGVGNVSGVRIAQADGLHGTEAQGVGSAAGDLFDGQAAFEVWALSQSWASAGVAAARAAMKASYCSRIMGQLM